MSTYRASVSSLTATEICAESAITDAPQTQAKAATTGDGAAKATGENRQHAPLTPMAPIVVPRTPEPAGDDAEPQPYAYVGPWSADRPGDPDYWNASFGSVLPYRAVVASGTLADVRGTLIACFRQGIDLLSAGAAA